MELPKIIRSKNFSVNKIKITHVKNTLTFDDELKKLLD